MIPNTISNTTRASAFLQTLQQIIRPKDHSDRVAFRRLAAWLSLQCSERRFDSGIFPAVLDLAREAAGPECRNPAAVFMSLVKKELAYNPKGANHESANPPGQGSVCNG